MNTASTPSKTSSTSPRLLKLAQRLKTDFPWYAERFLKIRTKDGRILSLRLNHVQRVIDDVWRVLEAAGKPVRIYVLKSRQPGVSTYTDAKLFHRTATRKNRSGLIISHDDDSAVTLFDMVKLFNDQLPSPLRPMQRYSNRRELVFENPNQAERPERPGLRSRLAVATAANLKAGRSKTLSDVHCSEIAFYRDLITLLTGLLQAVPDLPGTAIVLETTAQGAGSDAHKVWEEAKRGENSFTPVFIPWFWHEEYVLAFADSTDEAEFLASLTDEEKLARKLYGLSPAQLHWRREKIKSFDTIDLFFQEYPENDVDCWLTSGSPALPVKELRERQKDVKPPKWRGRLESFTEKDQDQIRFVSDAKGPLSVWKMPQAEHEYVVFADTSEGLPGGDYSCADVLDKETGEQVAQWHGLIDPDLLGSDVLPNLGWYYRQAEVGVERNNDGKTVLNELKKVYTKLFRTIQTDELTNKTTEKLGWLTTPRSKPIMVNELRRCLREDGVIINNPETIAECLTFVRYPNGTTAAQQNCKDDRVMSLCGALQMLQHHPYAPPRKPQRMTEPHYSDITGY